MEQTEFILDNDRALGHKKRSYRQSCALARTSDVLGERWTLLILRELLIQDCRFKDLNSYLEGMGTNLLSKRLKELEELGAIQKSSEKRATYSLTEQGRELEESVLAMTRWGYRWADKVGDSQDGFVHFHHWDLLAMKSLFVQARCERSMLIQFDCEELLAWVKVSPEGFSFALNERAEQVDIHLPMTIKDMQEKIAQQAFRGDQAMLDLLACFSV